MFNAGVYLVNTATYCRRRVFASMLDVGHYHATVQGLFRRAGNQPIMEIAAAQHTKHVSARWNCNTSAFVALGEAACSIVHFKRLHHRCAGVSVGDKWACKRLGLARASCLIWRDLCANGTVRPECNAGWLHDASSACLGAAATGTAATQSKSLAFLRLVAACVLAIFSLVFGLRLLRAKRASSTPIQQSR